MLSAPQTSQIPPQSNVMKKVCQHCAVLMCMPPIESLVDISRDVYGVVDHNVPKINCIHATADGLKPASRDQLV